MDLQSVSLKELENFANNLRKLVDTVENDLSQYETNIKAILDSTVGGEEALAEKALEGIMSGKKNLIMNTNALLSEVGRIIVAKKALIDQSAKTAQDLTY